MSGPEEGEITEIDEGSLVTKDPRGTWMILNLMAPLFGPVMETREQVVASMGSFNFPEQLDVPQNPLDITQYPPSIISKNPFSQKYRRS
jgi:hypothetical protein